MIEDISIWLKTSIPGIVLLGAIGSLLALALIRLLAFIVRRVIPLPLQIHKRKRVRQAYFLGFASAHFEYDTTGRFLSAYLAFHLSLLLIALFSFTLLASVSSFMLAYQGNTALTISVFISISTAFLCLYWAYFQFEYIYRTYLFFWKRPLEKAAERHDNWQSENADQD